VAGVYKKHAHTHKYATGKNTRRAQNTGRAFWVSAARVTQLGRLGKQQNGSKERYSTGARMLGP